MHKRILTPLLTLVWSLAALALLLRPSCRQRSAFREFARFGAALTAAHLAFIVLFDTALRYWKTLVPFAYGLVALALILSIEALVRVMRGTTTSGTPPLRESRHAAGPRFARL